MNTDDLSPSNALEDARYITAFLGASVSAFGAADDACAVQVNGHGTAERPADPRRGRGVIALHILQSV